MGAQAQHPLRVGLIGCTGLLGDIIAAAVRRDPQIAVVARLDAVPDLDGPAAHGLDEVDLLGWNGPEEAEVATWLSGARPRPRVLACVEDGRRSSLWELAPRRTELGALSPDLLTETIRTGARPDHHDHQEMP